MPFSTYRSVIIIPLIIERFSIFFLNHITLFITHFFITKQRQYNFKSIFLFNFIVSYYFSFNVLFIFNLTFWCLIENICILVDKIIFFFIFNKKNFNQLFKLYFKISNKKKIHDNFLINNIFPHHTIFFVLNNFLPNFLEQKFPESHNIKFFLNIERSKVFIASSISHNSTRTAH